MKADSEFMSKNANGLYGFCPTCGGPMCEHGICADNWCNADDCCPDCYAREEAEIEADLNAQYYQDLGKALGFDCEDK